MRKVYRAALGGRQAFNSASVSGRPSFPSVLLIAVPLSLRGSPISNLILCCRAEVLAARAVREGAD
jgi:hypothetical protein